MYLYNMLHSRIRAVTYTLTAMYHNLQIKGYRCEIVIKTRLDTLIAHFQTRAHKNLKQKCAHPHTRGQICAKISWTAFLKMR